MSPDHPLHAYIARGPVIAAHYRLVGPHSRPDLAAETIRATPAPLVETASLHLRWFPNGCADRLPSGHGDAAGQLVDRPDGGPWWSFRWDRMLHRLPDQRLMLAETGTLYLPDGTALEGGNRYIYELRDDTIDVTFADGANAGAHLSISRLAGGGWFVAAAIGWPASVSARQYDAILRLETPDRYVMTYVVCGPRKGYVSRSVYTRVGSSVA